MMNFLDGIKASLQGVKTYLVALGALIAAVVAFLNGDMDIVQTVQSIIAAIGLATLRGGVTTEAAKNKEDK